MYRSIVTKFGMSWEVMRSLKYVACGLLALCIALIALG